MNNVILRGVIQNIEHSHTIGLTDYYKANLIVPNTHKNDSDSLIIKFKKFNNKYQDGDYAEIYGNLRSYSERLQDGKNKVSVYVFTYQDEVPKDISPDVVNAVEIDGRICKVDDIRVTNSGKQTCHAILANNIITEDSNQKVNSYIPVVAWGKVAMKLSQCQVNSKVKVIGELHSRSYSKTLPNGEVEIRVAHELLATSLDIEDEEIKDN